MRIRHALFVFSLALAPVWAAAAEAKAPPSYEEARRVAWVLTGQLLETLAAGDAKQWPGTHAWIADLRMQTKGIGNDTPVAKWPKVDVAALVDHNPNFWRMYYEIAPGDPALTLIHAGVLLSQGEAMRAAYIVELGQRRPGIPKVVVRALHGMQANALAALKATNDLTAEGTRLFDRGDYDGAVKKYREALKLCPENGWASYELGYTLRTQAMVARGEPLQKPGVVKTEGTLNDPPETTAAFAASRRHDPLQYMAYQGTDPEVIRGCVAIVSKVLPAWKALRAADITPDAEHRALGDLSEGFSEAGVYDMALFARQLMAARRNGYDPADFPVIAAGLRKLAPGEKIEDVLVRVRGGKGKEMMTLRALTPQEREDGQPMLGSGARLYFPDKRPPKANADKPVRLDRVRLVTNADEIKNRASIESLARFIKQFEKIADDVLGKYETPCKILVQFTCAPSGHTVKIMHQPKDIDDKPLDELYKAIDKMEKLPVTAETVEFQVQLTVTPKKKPSTKPE